MKWDCLVVIAANYRHWKVGDDGQVEVLDEETSSPKTVGVYRNVEDCANACFSFILEEGEVGENGPVESVTVFAAEFGAKPGAGKKVAYLPLSGNRVDFIEEIRKGLES
jgi:hypothetical protein